ncbi:hypothetical protein Ccrd_026126 [Cynara cardunculus var. scolymus]|uniref:Uncharacterized protein n=1 Tax=Cynara cardunculus var. scolymus TaxID=59895 RepID=A0A103SPA7_CYNCS|nr:hypothetical protein Ccrd_026126 [Cynara cardunculus var. scolymus]
MVDDCSGVKIAPMVRWVSTALGSTDMLGLPSSFASFDYFLLLVPCFAKLFLSECPICCMLLIC